jgi:hypothetical protein
MSSQTQNIVTDTRFSELKPQNNALAGLIRDSYSSADLEAVRKALVKARTLELKRYKSGGHSAVTVLDANTLENSIDGLLIYMWDRDNIMQCLAELMLAENSSLNEGLSTTSDAWKRGLNASITHHRKGEGRFLDIIQGRASGYPKDYFRRPHIRYNPISLHEVGDPWGHGQNDSLSFVNFLLFHALRTNRMQWSEQASAFAVLLHSYFWTIHVWEDQDLGAWEDKVAQHWSSIACALVSLREQQALLFPNGAMRYNKDGQDFWITEHGVKELIEKCEAKLRELGTREFIHSDNGDTRNADLAQLNPLLLAAVAGQPVLDDANTVAILENIERELMGHIGIRRYNKDVWDGRVNRYDLSPGEEAQWCHGSPQMSYIYGELFQRTGDSKFFEKQLFHFNRAVASVPPSGFIPEAYIVDVDSREWVIDANEPLAWTQSMMVMALGQMQASLAKQGL